MEKKTRVNRKTRSFWIYILRKIKVRSWKQYGKAEMKFHSSLTSALDGAADEIHAPAALPPENRLWYPSKKNLGGPQSRSGSSAGEKKNLSPARIRTTIPL
jgi:hypothetical protein